MFERFTEGARQVVVLGQEEARTLKHNYIGTEHILLGLLRQENGLAAQVLYGMDITVEYVRAQVVRIVGSADEVSSGQIPFTPRAKKVLELALREALDLGHDYIGTEHILLGLVHETEGVAAKILLEFDADSEEIRKEVIKRLGAGEGDPDSASPPSPTPEIGPIKVSFSTDVRQLLMAAAARSLDRGETEVDLHHLLLAIADDESAVNALGGLLGNRADKATEPESED